VLVSPQTFVPSGILTFVAASARGVFPQTPFRPRNVVKRCGVRAEDMMARTLGESSDDMAKRFEAVSPGSGTWLMQAICFLT
jgi:hypothetical protein